MLFPCSLVVRAGRSWIGLLPGCVLMLCSGRPRPGRPARFRGSSGPVAPSPRRHRLPTARAAAPAGTDAVLGPDRPGAARCPVTRPDRYPPRAATGAAAPGCGSAHGSLGCARMLSGCAQAGPARLRCSPRCPAAPTPPPPVRSWSLQTHPFPCRRVGAGHRCFWPFHSSCYCPESVPRLRRPRICFPMTLDNFCFDSQHPALRPAPQHAGSGCGPADGSGCCTRRAGADAASH
jgi:hypothetical protein